MIRAALSDALKWPHTRSAVGLLSSSYLALHLWVETGFFFRSVIFGSGWGLCLLYGVQLRGLIRQDESVSWTGALAAGIAWSLTLGLVFFGVGKILYVLDLTAILYAAIYIAAKLGCHNIGCCNWNNRSGRSISLPALEMLLTATTIGVTVVVVRYFNLNHGILFMMYMTAHVISWLGAKRWRNPGEV